MPPNGEGRNPFVEGIMKIFYGDDDVRKIAQKSCRIAKVSGPENGFSGCQNWRLRQSVHAIFHKSREGGEVDCQYGQLETKKEGGNDL